MGKYINPPDQTNESWLEANGRPVTQAEAKQASDTGDTPVCLVNNGPFKAAGIAYDRSEFEVFTSPNDGRPKQWYLVPADALAPHL
jgi:hypothetical protein